MATFQENLNKLSNALYGYEVRDAIADMLTELKSLSVPNGQNIVGAIIPFAGDVAPDGYLICDGRTLSISQYSALYSVIGTKYGAPAGGFSLPDLRGRVPVGMLSTSANFNAIGKRGGTETHTLSVAEMPAHRHSPMSIVTAGALAGSTAMGTAAGTAYTTNAVAEPLSGGGQAHNNLQPFLTINYIIKY